MAQLKPFKAWRPKPKYLERTACVPYDVINSKEARKLAEGNPDSFLHVIRPEINLSDQIDIYSDEVYEVGKNRLYEFLASERFEQDEENAVYVYRLTWKGESKTGIFGCVSVQDYDDNVILKHELTTPIKEDDRTKHIITQKAHAEPVMMTFRGNPELNNAIDSETKTEPIFQFTVEDGVEHTIWRCASTETIVQLFDKIPHLYIADGHHRCASASRAAKELDSTYHPEVNFFPAVLFPMEELQIMAYNRIVFDVPQGFLDLVSEAVDLRRTENPIPENREEARLYFEGVWYSFKIPESAKKETSAQLDVARLQEYILEPILGITNQRTDTNISFVGGIHGAEKLQQIVDNGEAKAAISLYPTSIEELVAVSNAGELMPPKSTWFEPKLRSGILIHTF